MVGLILFFKKMIDPFYRELKYRNIINDIKNNYLKDNCLHEIFIINFKMKEISLKDTHFEKMRGFRELIFDQKTNTDIDIRDFV